VPVDLRLVLQAHLHARASLPVDPLTGKFELRSAVVTVVTRRHNAGQVTGPLPPQPLADYEQMLTGCAAASAEGARLAICASRQARLAQ